MITVDSRREGPGINGFWQETTAAATITVTAAAASTTTT
jgi:hypothetical protein